MQGDTATAPKDRATAHDMRCTYFIAVHSTRCCTEAYRAMAVLQVRVMAVLEAGDTKVNIDWTLGTMFWILDTMFWILDTMFWTLDTMFWILDTMFWTLDTMFWILDTMFWTLDTMFWTLDTMFWTLDPMTPCRSQYHTGLLEGLPS